MKNIYFILFLASLVYLGYAIWQDRNKPVGPAPIPALAAVAAATPTPTPSPAPALPIRPALAPVAFASPTPVRNLAPPGTYFLLQRISITTDSGIIGIAPGTKVTMVIPGPPMHVTDGQNVFEVQPNQVTNDLDIAARVFNADQNAQAAISAMRAQEAQQAAAQLEADQKAMQAKQRALGAEMAAQPLPMSTGELDEGPKPVNTIGDGGNYKSAIH